MGAKWFRVALIVVLLNQITTGPCLAATAGILTGDRLGPDHLKVGQMVEVVYRDRTGERQTAEGRIKAVYEDSFVIGKGLWKEGIAYQDVISLQHPDARDLTGARVRISTPRQVVGTLVSTTHDALTLMPENGNQMEIPWPSIARLEVWHKTNRGALGATIGLLVGTLGGALVWSTTVDESQYLDMGSLWVLPVAIASGILIGARIGMAHGSEAWRVVPLDKVRVGLSFKQHRRLTLSACLRF